MLCVCQFSFFVFDFLSWWISNGPNHPKEMDDNWKMKPVQQSLLNRIYLNAFQAILSIFGLKYQIVIIIVNKTSSSIHFTASVRTTHFQIERRKPIQLVEVKDLPTQCNGMQWAIDNDASERTMSMLQIVCTMWIDYVRFEPRWTRVWERRKTIKIFAFQFCTRFANNDRCRALCTDRAVFGMWWMSEREG